MPALIEVKVTGLTELQRGLKAAPDTTADATHSAMQASCLLLEADQRRHVAQDTRRLMTSITHRIEGTGANLTGRVGPSVRYGYFVEHGRRPGKPPPVDAVAGWARRHGIPPFMLARAIGRRGTRAQPFVAPSLTRNRHRIVQLFDKVGVRIAARIAR